MSAYNDIISAVFLDHYRPGVTSVVFEREELIEKAAALHLARPKNIGDIVYTFKFRKRLPRTITQTAPNGFYWRIRNVGTAQHELVLTPGSEFIEPDRSLPVVKIPDGTPGIVRKYSLSDEQALLTIIRYNRLIDVFLGIACYSLQNHLRTTVTGIGQIETDEIYVGVDKAGRQFIVPVQAKGGTDKLGISQIEQDLALCSEKYPDLICKAVACQFLTRDTVAMFAFGTEEDRIVKTGERHYRIVDAESISGADLRAFAVNVIAENNMD